MYVRSLVASLADSIFRLEKSVFARVQIYRENEIGWLISPSLSPIRLTLYLRGDVRAL
jgi:hypothetical protein